MGIIFLFSYNSDCFGLLMHLFISLFFPPRKDCCDHVHKYNRYHFILPLWGLVFYMLICDILTRIQNVIHPPNHAAIKQYLRSTQA